jgi:hypothetical protein
LSERLAKEARRVEMDRLKKHGAYENRSIKECWETTGKKPREVGRADANEGDKENPRHSCC